MLTTLLRTPSNLMRRGACERKNVVTPLALGIHQQGKPRMYHNQQDLASFLAERTNSSSSCSSLTFAHAQAGGSAHLGGASVSDNMGDVNEACSSSMKVYVMLPLDTVSPLVSPLVLVYALRQLAPCHT